MAEEPKEDYVEQQLRKSREARKLMNECGARVVLHLRRAAFLLRNRRK